MEDARDTGRETDRRKAFALTAAPIAVAATGGLLQIFWEGARNHGVGVLVLCLGLFFTLLRVMLQKLEKSDEESARRIDALTTASRLLPGTLEAETNLSPIAIDLWSAAVDDHRALFAGIHEGFPISGEQKVVGYLLRLTRGATRTIHVIDHTDVRAWSESDALGQYLEEQLRRAKDGQIALERIRLVREEDLGEDPMREALVRFAQLHAEAGAALLFGLDDLVEETVLWPRGGMLLVDRELRPACLTGRIEGRHIGAASVYLKRVAQMQAAVDAYALVRERIEQRSHDQAIRERLGLTGSTDAA